VKLDLLGLSSGWFEPHEFEPPPEQVNHEQGEEIRARANPKAPVSGRAHSKKARDSNKGLRNGGRLSTRAHD